MVNASYPKTLKEALESRKQNAGKSLVICGGSDVMVVHKTAENVIFVNNVEEMRKVNFEKGRLFIGASVTYSELLDDERIPGILRKAIEKIASPAIRNVGTVAGNICNASPAGDTLPVLYVLNAAIQVSHLGDDGEICSKEIPINQFILGIRKINLKEDEIVSGIFIDEKEFKDYSIYYEKVGARQSEAISKVSFAALFKTSGSKIENVKIAFGSVGITVAKFDDLEKEIDGLSIQELPVMKNQIVEKYMERIKPIDDQRSTAFYRKTVCKNLLSDFLDSITAKREVL